MSDCDLYGKYGQKLTNAKMELLYHVNISNILYANIRIRKECEYPFKSVILHSNHTQEDAEKFLTELDMGYDSGYGIQNLDGIVLTRYGAIFTRDEYDGLENWQYAFDETVDYDLREIINE